MVNHSLSRRSAIKLLLGAPLAAAGVPALAAAQTSGGTPVPFATPASVTPHLPVTVTDVSGKKVTVTDISRIVPLSGDIAEIIWDLGLGSHIVAVDVSATYPPQLQKLPSIGFEMQLSAEGILKAKPTVVIGRPEASPASALAQVRSAGVPLVIVAEPQSLAAPTDKIREVSAALGVPEVGDQLASEVQAQINQGLALAKQATSHPVVMFLYVRAGGIQLIGGAGSVADIGIKAAGGIDAGTKAGIKGFQPVTAEAMIAAAPEYIIVPLSGMESVGGIQGVLKVPGVAETPAGKNKHILAFDDLELLDLTPRTGQMLITIVRAIHPELASVPLPVASPVASPAA